MKEQEILVRSTLDGTLRPSLYYKADGADRPLLVALHTWSFDRRNQIGNFLPVAEKYNFNLLLPEFRGPNLKSNPECRDACGSLLARRDVMDAIDYVIENEGADPDNVMLHGASGGGHMALMLAGYAPERFKAVSSVVPITDLSLWAEQNKNYRDSVIACCTDSREEMLSRSPITYLDDIARSNIKIFHGKYDPVVPVSHSLSFYAEMMKKHPTSRAFLDIFDGGHECDIESVMHWLLSQLNLQSSVGVSG